MDFTLIEITQDNFQEEVIENDSLVLIDFYADWCGPCKKMDVSIKEINQQYADKIKICKANLEDNSQLAAKYEIMSLPAILFFKEGKFIQKHVGLRSKKDLVLDIEGLV